MPRVISFSPKGWLASRFIRRFPKAHGWIHRNICLNQSPILKNRFYILSESGNQVKPILVTLKGSPDPQNATLPVLYSSGATGGSGTYDDYFFDFGDGQSVHSPTNSVNHSYDPTQTQTYDAMCTVTDSKGNTGESPIWQEMIDVNPPPPKIPDILPRSPLPPASTVYFVTNSGKLDKSAPANFQTAALQGLIARVQPQVYLTGSGNVDTPNTPFNTMWYNWIQSYHPGFKFSPISEAELFQKFATDTQYSGDGKGNCKVVTYGDNPWTVSMARVVAGIEGAIPMHVNDSLPGGVPHVVVKDVSGEAEDFETFYNTYASQCEGSLKYNLVIMTGRGTASPEITDYIVQHKLAEIFLFHDAPCNSPSSCRNVELLNNVLPKFKSDNSKLGITMGFWCETGGGGCQFGLEESVYIETISKMGWGNILQTWVPNTSLFTGYPPTTLSQEHDFNKLDYSKIPSGTRIVCMNESQFDSPEFVWYRSTPNTVLETQFNNINSAKPRPVSLGWTLSELILCPPFHDWMIKNRLIGPADQQIYLAGPESIVYTKVSQGTSFVNPAQDDLASKAGKFGTAINFNDYWVISGANDADMEAWANLVKATDPNVSSMFSWGKGGTNLVEDKLSITCVNNFNGIQNWKAGGSICPSAKTNSECFATWLGNISSQFVVAVANVDFLQTSDFPSQDSKGNPILYVNHLQLIDLWKQANP